MDRLDSLLPAAPVTFLLLSWLVPAVGDLRTGRDTARPSPVS